MYDFQSLEEVESVLAQLNTRETGALVKTLERMPGQKENRVMHLLGDDEVENSYIKTEKKDEPDKTQAVEEEITNLKEQVKRLEEKLDNFIKQFK